MKRAFVVVAFLFAIIDIGAAAPPALNTEGGAALGTFHQSCDSTGGEVPGCRARLPDRTCVLDHEAFGKMSTAKALEMKKDTIFNIASMTKAVTSVGVMMLVDEGKLGLDDEVSKEPAAVQSPAGAEQSRCGGGNGAYLSGEAFGDAGRVCVIEEGMTGPELSVFVLCDGTDANRSRLRRITSARSRMTKDRTPAEWACTRRWPCRSEDRRRGDGARSGRRSPSSAYVARIPGCVVLRNHDHARGAEGRRVQHPLR